MKQIRLEDVLPSLRKQAAQRTESERIADLELSVHYLKSRVAVLESRRVDE